MRLHEVNAGTLNPADSERLWGAPFYVCRCLIIEIDAGIVLVDTGIGLRDIAAPDERLGQDWLAMARPGLRPEECLARQLPRLGLNPAEVCAIVLTHGHRDHVGGLADFPAVPVHCLPPLRNMVEAALTGRCTLPSPLAQWEHGIRWAPAPQAAGLWHGLPVHTLHGLPEQIRMVELPGHAVGHAGVLVEADQRSLLHVGDAAFHPSQYQGRPVPPGVAAFTQATQNDPVARQETERQLRMLAVLPGLELLTAHGPHGNGTL